MMRYRQPGTVVTDHRFEVPLRHADSAGEKIEVFAREIVAAQPGAAQLPVLLFFQGGPGCASPRPVGRDSWLGRALREYRVLLLDQRGTGRSTPADRHTLTARGGPAVQADYLTNFRADSIVADAELIRRALIGEEPFSVLGQSFGGFCTLTYLSIAPQGLREAFITGGLPSLDALAEDVYRATYPTVIAKTLAHYQRYPDDEHVASTVVRHLREHVERFPGGGLLTVEAFQSLGILLGRRAGSHELHYLLELAGPTRTRLPDAFLAEAETYLRMITRPLYAVLHEACYAQRTATQWAAQRVRSEFPSLDATAAMDSGAPVLFTGEMIFPWMFDTDPALAPLREVADILAERSDWPELYDPAQLAANTVPVHAAVYYDDMYVNRELSLRTAAEVQGLQTWITNEHDHDGLSASDGGVLDHLIAGAT